MKTRKVKARYSQEILSELSLIEQETIRQAMDLLRDGKAPPAYLRNVLIRRLEIAKRQVNEMNDLGK